MKVLVLPSWYPPDKGSFFREQSLAIARAGIEIDVLSLRIKGIREITKEPSLLLKRRIVKNHDNGIDVYRAIYLKYPLTEKYNIAPWAKRVLYFFERYIAANGFPDLIHVHGSLRAGYAASIIYEKYNIPYIVTEHSGIFVENNPVAQRQIKPFYKEFLQKALKNASKVILVSDKLRRVILDIEPSISNRIVVIPNFIDTNIFTPLSVTLPEKPFIFLSIGHLEHLKGMDILINAFSILKKRITHPVMLKIGATGSQISKLKSQASNLGIEQDVVFSGRRLSRSEVNTYMQNSHAFVLASRFEAFGVVLVEAMATGLPVISTRSGGPEEIINKESGYLVDLEDPDGLAEAMECMIVNYRLFDRRAIRDQAIKKYSRESNLSKIIGVYDEVLSKSRLEPGKK